MRHIIQIDRDVMDDQGVLVAHEQESLVLDDKIDPPEVWDHYMSTGAFGVGPAVKIQ
jgi:hypothetical protein